MSVDCVLTRIELNENTVKSIGERWRVLEEKSHKPSFFISWGWIESWLLTLIDHGFALPIHLFEGKADDETVCLGFVVEKKGRAKRTQYWLNKTGLQKFDQPWIEYNQLLMHKELTPEHHQYIYRKLFNTISEKRAEFHLDMSMICVKKIQSPLDCYKTLSAKGYKMPLLKSHGPVQLLNSLSKNTRYQINRTKRLLSEQGELLFTVHHTLKDKQHCLEAMSGIHQKKWRSSEYGSGFDNPIFVDFHNRLIKSDATVIATFSIDSEILAYGYYFCYRDTVYFYLSAIQKSDDNRIKTGLLLHTKAMSYFQEQGFAEYDFLCGDARYKDSLSDMYYWQHSNCFISNDWLLQFEHVLRRGKRLLFAKDAS